MLYYGTSEEEADRILEIGLKPVNQHYVHLSKSIEEAVKVACIRTEHPVIIEVDARKAQRERHPHPGRGARMPDAQGAARVHTDRMNSVPEFIRSDDDGPSFFYGEPPAGHFFHDPHVRHRVRGDAAGRYDRRPFRQRHERDQLVAHERVDGRARLDLVGDDRRRFRADLFGGHAPARPARCRPGSR